MNIELSITEVSFPESDQPPSNLVCEVQLSSALFSTPLPTPSPLFLPFSPDQLDEQLILTLRDCDVIGTARVTLRDLAHGEKGKWYPLRSPKRGKLILKTPVASLKIIAKVTKRKTQHRSHSSLPSIDSLKEIQSPLQSPVSDNPNPSPLRPYSSSAYSSPERAPLEIEQALNTVNEKVQTFQIMDGEMGKIQHQLAGLISSINTLESFEGESEAVFPHVSKIEEISHDTKGEISPIEDRLGQDLRKTLGFLKSQATSRGSPSVQNSEFDDLRHDLKAVTDLQKSQEQELEDLRTKHADFLQTAKDNGVREKAARDSLVSEKEAMARVVAKLSKDLKQNEEMLRSANHELRLMKLEQAANTAENTIKSQPAKVKITPAAADFTHMFEAQMEQHKILAEKYAKMFQECKSHRSLIAELETKLAEKSHELDLSRLQSEKLTSEVAALRQTSHFLDEENQKFKAIGIASAARIEELTELTRDVDILSNVSLIHSEKALAAHIVIAKLTAMLKEKDEELKRFRNVALPKYCPDPEDQTDVALGSYLSDNLVQVPFIREEPGVYRFGTKRVFIRLEQGNIIIRVGGGYMHLDEFIDIYTPQELGKMSPKPEDGIRMALAQKLMEQMDEKFVPCIGLNKKDPLPPSDN